MAGGGIPLPAPVFYPPSRSGTDQYPNDPPGVLLKLRSLRIQPQFVSVRGLFLQINDLSGINSYARIEVMVISLWWLIQYVAAE